VENINRLGAARRKPATGSSGSATAADPGRCRTDLNRLRGALCWPAAAARSIAGPGRYRFRGRRGGWGSRRFERGDLDPQELRGQFEHLGRGGVLDHLGGADRDRKLLVAQAEGACVVVVVLEQDSQLEPTAAPTAASSVITSVDTEGAAGFVVAGSSPVQPPSSLRLGYRPVERTLPSTITIGRQSWPSSCSIVRTRSRSAKTPGSCPRLWRRTGMPLPASHSRSPAKEASAASTLVPHTPVEPGSPFRCSATSSSCGSWASPSGAHSP